MPSKKGEPFRWDPLVRLTHWGLAAVCIGNLWVNEAGEEWHEWLGYGAIGLVFLRLLWGLTFARGYARLGALIPMHQANLPRLVAHASNKVEQTLLVGVG